MKIINFKLHTRQNEVVNLNEVKMLSFGILENDNTFATSTKELFIICKQGDLRFDLNDIIHIDFVLENEKDCVCVNSRLINNIEGGE